MFDPADFWGPYDTIRGGIPFFTTKFVEVGSGPYLALVPIIRYVCDCGKKYVKRKHIIMSIYDYEDAGVWYLIVKCPKCGKVWRDVQ